VDGVALQWFQSYLKGRTQSICINKCQSDKKCLICSVPQGSVLGPLLYVLYTYGIGDILRHHNLEYHLYADDTQLYIAFCPKTNGDLYISVERLQVCIKDIRNWMTTNYLKLNEDKTEFIMFASPYYSKRLPVTSILVGNDFVRSSDVVRNLGAHFDNQLSMDKHVIKATQAAYLHLRRIRYIRKYLSKQNTEKLVHAFITSKLDLNNGLLYGITNTLTLILKKVLYSAARLVTGVGIREHMTPVLKSLHWLPIDKRIMFKLCLLVYKCLNGLAPAYLSDLIVPLQRKGLRSSNESLLKVSKTKNSYGDRSFSVCGPAIWNQLPESVRVSPSLDAFKKNLKTHFFTC